MKKIAVILGLLALAAMSVAVWAGIESDDAGTAAGDDLQFDDYEATEAAAREASQRSTGESESGSNTGVEEESAKAKAEENRGESKTSKTEIRVLGVEKTESGGNSKNSPKEGARAKAGASKEKSNESSTSNDSPRPIYDPSIADDIHQIQIQREQAVPRALRNLEKAPVQFDAKRIEAPEGGNSGSASK